MFFEKRVLKTLERIRSRVAVPLRIQFWNGRRFDFCNEPSVVVTIPDSAALRYFISPNLDSLGRAFVEGHIRVEGSARNVFQVAQALARQVTSRLPSALHWARQHSRDHDRQAVQYHYDVSDDFYALFLDANMVYSCAYYQHASDILEEAQNRKLDHILNKLRLAPGEQLLDIGCGWGALVMRAVQKYGARATGITLSQNQFDAATRQIRQAGLERQCRVLLCDYRDLAEADKYDKIASVGMFEHVGLKNLPEYFGVVHRLLKHDGLVLNHGITTSDVQSRWVGMGAGEFIDRYVFPQGELPHVSLALKEMAGAGLEVLDVESLRRHYAGTCDAWSDKLEVNRTQAQALVGERRYRIWQIYLAGCAYGFANGWMNLYQVLCSKAANVALSQQPLTRDYMYARAA